MHIKKVYSVCFLIALSILMIACSSINTTGINSLPKYGKGSVPIFIPKHISLTKFNGNKVILPKDFDYIFYVDPGKHGLLLTYHKDWKDSSLNELSTGGRRIKKIVEWEPVEIKHQYLSGNQYRVNFSEPENIKDARSKITFSPIWVENSSETPKAAEVNTRAPVVSMSEANVEPPLETKDDAIVPEDVSSLGMLKYWWNKSTEEERKTFWLWIYEK